MYVKPLGSRAVQSLIKQVKSIRPGANPYEQCRPIFLISGRPGVGKTSLICDVVEKLQDEVPSRRIRGFYTAELRDGKDRIGFEVVTMDGQRGLLAHVDESKIPSGQALGEHYKLDIATFEKLALPSLQIRRDTSLYVIDEIGKMELSCPKFFPAVTRILQSRIPVLASIPTPSPRADPSEVDDIADLPNIVQCALSRSNRRNNAELIFTLMNRIV